MESGRAKSDLVTFGSIPILLHQNALEGEPYVTPPVESRPVEWTRPVRAHVNSTNHTQSIQLANAQGTHQMGTSVQVPVGAGHKFCENHWISATIVQHTECSASSFDHIDDNGNRLFNPHSLCRNTRLPAISLQLCNSIRHLLF